MLALLAGIGAELTAALTLLGIYRRQAQEEILIFGKRQPQQLPIDFVLEKFASPAALRERKAARYFAKAARRFANTRAAETLMTILIHQWVQKRKGNTFHPEFELHI